jgi:hypothetical protein
MSMSMKPSCVFLGNVFILSRIQCLRCETEHDESTAGIQKLVKEV